MKKLIFAILACLVVCTQINAKEEVKFKNPIFYNKLIADRGGPDYILTPTWLKSDWFVSVEGPCELLANEESYIIITCTIKEPSGYTYVYKDKYELLDDCAKIENTVVDHIPNDDDICLVQNYGYNVNTDKIESSTLYYVQKIYVRKTK